jgi:NADPH:quinone reductase-like Zn-dependent oxidoreductase
MQMRRTSANVYGEQAIVPAAVTVKHPDNLSWEHAAAIRMQYLTAYGERALVENAAAFGLTQADSAEQLKIDEKTRISRSVFHANRPR